MAVDKRTVELDLIEKFQVSRTLITEQKQNDARLNFAVKYTFFKPRPITVAKHQRQVFPKRTLRKITSRRRNSPSIDLRMRLVRQMAQRTILRFVNTQFGRFLENV